MSVSIGESAVGITQNVAESAALGEALAAIDEYPMFTGTVDTDPEEAIMQRVSAMCLNGVCLARQEGLAREMAPWAAAGGRITPATAAARILERMGCQRHPFDKA